MGPRRLWIALLLAALQYAGVHAAGCDGAPKPKSVCPQQQPTSIDCKERPQSDKVDKPCAAGSLFLSRNGNEQFVKLKKIDCPTGETDWKAIFEITGNHKLSAQDTVVCAQKPPKLSCTPLQQADCANYPEWACETITKFPLDDAPLYCPTTSNNVYINKGAQWEGGEIKCERDGGKWMHGGNPVTAGAQVVCADSPPNRKSCMADVPLTSSCDATLSATVECEELASFNDDNPPKCTSPKNLYSKGSSVATTWVQTDNVATCDKKAGTWMNAASNTVLSKNDVVICATSDPTVGSCDAPLPDSCPTYTPTIADCQKPSPSCPAAKPKLYYKMAPSAPGTEMKWMLANSIKCVDAKWMVEYNYGTKTKEDELDLNNAHVICTASDQDAKVCEYDALMSFEEKNSYTVMAPQPTYVEAGAAGKCISTPPNSLDKDMDIYSADGQTVTKDMMGGGTYPICRPDGNWEWIKVESGAETNHIMGKKIVCRIKKCNTCQIGTIPDFFLPNSLVDIDNGDKDYSSGTCSSVKCPNSENKFAVMKGSENTMRYYTGLITCDNDGSTWKDDKGVQITKALCIQRLYCHDPASMMIDYTCPAGMTDCQQIGMPGPNDKSQSVVWEKLKCPTSGYKILIRPNTGATQVAWNDPNAPWDDVKSINCDKSTGKWKVEFPEGPSEQRDEKNTVICAKENSNKRTTTTTTTTTRGPALPICTLCEMKKPANITECEQCDSSKLIYDSPNDNKCIIKAAEGDKLVINMMEDVDAIYCERTELYDENVKWTKQDGTEVLKISARTESKRDSWRTMSYVVVAIVFVAIGGMGIGCVVIYMRMRKKLSVREGKKERGVTKKLTSSNVVKTGNVKSSAAAGSMEKGKSKEPVKSKMDDKDEDAPTLKL